jgi:mannose-6-phosphate isomerase-like protein (cupin superfamily)
VRNAAISPLASWFAGIAAMERFRRRWLGRAPVALPPRDRAWHSVAPGFTDSVGLAASGLPFQVAADREYDRAGDPRQLRRALARGETVFLPQVHQVLPRLMRLMVALRATCLGPFREECSFLFLVEGIGREGMGLHHDGEVDQFWLQLEGRRTVTVGPPVPRDIPEDLQDRRVRAGRRAGWQTRELPPGTLFYLPPRTPHRVVCHARSLALSMTWKAPGPRAAEGPGRSRFGRARALAGGLLDWDVVSGQADGIPPAARGRLWTQAPAVAGPIDERRGEFPLWVAGGAELWLPAGTHDLATRLATMPAWRRGADAATGELLARLDAHGIVAPRDLPLRIIPEDPAALDGWRFA